MIVLKPSTRPNGVMHKCEWRAGTSAGGERTATVCCPVCGKIGSLTDHAIHADGKVEPSLVCPFTCGFHDFVQLEGWA